MIEKHEIAAMMKAVGAVVKDFVAARIAPLSRKQESADQLIAGLEARMAAIEQQAKER